MSKYCPNCGRQLPDVAMFCDHCGTRMPDLSQASFQEETQSVYYFADTMSEAAEEAIVRNESGEWSYWSTADAFHESARNVRRFSAKEEKRLRGDTERPRYVVSASGAIGQYFTDEDGGTVLEWVYLTRQEGDQDLPHDVDDLR